jgi:hypothetical protein
MALTVPDESLATLAEAKQYHAERGNAAWATLATGRQEQLLRQAYDWLFDEYAARWPADVEFGTINEAGDVPPKMRQACALLALYAIDGPLNAPPSTAPQVVEKTVGPLTTKYATQDAPVKRTFPDVARMVAPYLVAKPSPYSARIVRN